MFTPDILLPGLSLTASPKDTALLGGLWVWLFLSCVNTSKLLSFFLEFLIFLLCVFVGLFLFVCFDLGFWEWNEVRKEKERAEKEGILVVYQYYPRLS